MTGVNVAEINGQRSVRTEDRGQAETDGALREYKGEFYQTGTVPPSGGR